MNLILDPPNPKQELFFHSFARYVAYGGARAGGKSWAMRTRMVLLCLQYAGLQALLLRRTLPELTENHVNPLLKLLKGVAIYNKQEKVFAFPNGSRLKLGYCAAEGDVLQYQGQAYDVIGLEEATMFTEYQFNCLRESNRSSGMMKDRFFKPMMLLTCNPGGVGHQWFKRLFVDRRYTEKERPEDYRFVQANVYDNKVFLERDPDYVAQLETLPEKRRRMMLLGEWDVPEGAYFEEFTDDPSHYKDRRYTHVIAPFEIPSDWTIYRSLDWGYNKPSSVQWHAIDRDGVMYLFTELYTCAKNEPNVGLRWTPQELFKEVARIESEHPWLKGKKILGVADPAIWDAEMGESIADVAAKYRIYFQPGDHKRIPGAMQCHYRLSFDENGYPMFYVFNTCKEFIRTIPLLQYDAHKIEDIDTSMEDHHYDAWRYLCMNHILIPRSVKKKDEYLDSPLRTILDIKKEDLAPAPTREAKYEIIEE